jgi:hypothetical protein
MSVATHAAPRIPAARGILAAFIPGGGLRSFSDGHHRRAGITGQGTGDANRNGLRRHVPVALGCRPAEATMTDELPFKVVRSNDHGAAREAQPGRRSRAS